MSRELVDLRWIALLLLASSLLVAACAPAAAPAPTAAPAKPTAPAPTAEPAKPAAPAPTAAPAKPAAEPTKAAPAASVELRAGCNNPKDDMLCDGVDKFAELVALKSNGTLTVRVFYQSLGAEQQLTQSVMSGSVDIGMLTGGNAARFTDALMVYDLPFLLKKYENTFKTLSSPAGKEMMQRFDKELGVKTFFILSQGGGRDIQTRNKPLRVPADIKGLKIRVISSPVDMTTFKAWGANPTPVDWGQTYAALQQGVVDGEGIPVLGMIGAKHQEIVKHVLRIQYQSLFTPLFINAKKFDSLSPQHQKALMDAAQEAQPWDIQHVAQMVEGALKEAAKAGVTVYTPTADEYAQWASVRESVWNDVNKEMQNKIDLKLANTLYQSQ